MADHLERIIRIYNRLRRGPVTIEIISKWAKQAGIVVSDRQLYRDLEQLKRFALADGEMVKEFVNEKNKKIWKLEYKEKSEKLTSYDINSFFLLKNFAPYAVLEERKSSIEKFEKIIYKNFSHNNFQQYIQANELLLRHTNFMENMYGAEEHTKVEELIWALHNKRILIVEKDLINVANIDIDKNPFPFPMYPMELVFHKGRMHLSGLTKQNQFVIFAVDKQLCYSLTNEIFSRKRLLPHYKSEFDKLFGISKAVDGKTYHIKLEFARGYAESFKNFHWHATQEWKELKNGNYMLSFQSSIGRELVGFIALGLAMVKVHQPKTLKDLVLKKFKETVDVYEKNLPVDGEKANEGY